MDISSEIRARIITAADQLYQSVNRERFPTVDQVRRAARADMNTTSVIMKEWRKQQTAMPATVAAPIPDRVRDAALASAALTWSESQELANESLDMAKAAWEAERADAEEMRAELADAYESQEKELASVLENLTKTEATVKAVGEKCESTASDLAKANENLANESMKRAEMERREQVAQQRIEELREELAQEKTDANQQVNQHRTELEIMRTKQEQQATADAEKLAALQKQYESAVQELATVKARAEAQQEAATDWQAAAKSHAEKLSIELEKSQKNTANAREKVAELTGKLGAVMTQNKEFMALFEILKNRESDDTQ